MQQLLVCLSQLEADGGCCEQNHGVWRRWQQAMHMLAEVLVLVTQVRGVELGVVRQVCGMLLAPSHLDLLTLCPLVYLFYQHQHLLSWQLCCCNCLLL